MIDRFLDRIRGSPDQLELFVNMIVHGRRGAAQNRSSDRSRARRYCETSNFLSKAATASSHAFSAPLPAKLVAATKAASFAGATQMTANHIVFEPVWARASPHAHPRACTVHPIANFPRSPDGHVSTPVR